MMAPLLEEEENYVRLALLLKGVSPRAVRSYFDGEFPPTYLPSTLNTNFNTLQDLKLKRVLTQAQWNLLFPRNGFPVSTTFDVTLMICLIRNLTSVTQPINGFDRLPLPVETTPGPDLARIKWYRNILAHHDSNKMATGDFNIAWSNISDAVSRLGGQPMNQECQELKVKILDQSNLEIMLEIKQSQEKIKELGQTVDILGTEHSEVTENLRKLQVSHITLQTDHSEVTGNLRKLQDSHITLQTEHREVTELLKDPIPWNIREALHKTLEAWRLEDNDFVETNASSNLLTAISQQDTAVKTVIGPRGCGKSSLIKHIAVKMQTDGYDVLPVTGINQITKWFHPTGKQLFVLDIDNACQTPVELGLTLKKWQNQLAALETRIQGTKIIACCSTDIYENPEFQKISGLHQHKFDLKADDNILSDEDRKAIATKYMREDEFDALLKDMKEILKTLDNFPMLCSKFAEDKHGDPTQYFAECISNLTTNDTLVENQNTQVDINVSNSLTNNPVQGVKDMFVNPTFNNCAINFNVNINPINKN